MKKVLSVVLVLLIFSLLIGCKNTEVLNSSSVNDPSSVFTETIDSQTSEEINEQNSKDYTQAIDNYIDVFGDGNLQNIGKIAPNAYWQFLQNQTNKSYDEIINSLIKDGQYRITMIKSRYGDNVTTNYTILNKTEVSEEELQKITATLKDNYLSEDLCAEKGYNVKLEGHVKGTKFENKVTPTITVVQIDHNWYVIVYIERNNKANVLFMSEALFY